MSEHAAHKLRWWHHFVPPRWHRIEQRHERELAALHEREWVKMARVQSELMQKKARRGSPDSTWVYQGGSGGKVSIVSHGAGGAGGSGRMIEHKGVELHR